MSDTLFKRLGTKGAKKKHTTREGWMMSFVEHVKPVFKSLKHPLPTVRVSCGMPSRKRVGGVCYHSICSEDSAREIFVSAGKDNSIDVLQILIHELCHAALPDDAKHGPAFCSLAKQVGLEGKMTESVPSEELVKCLHTFIKSTLGKYPHRKMIADESKKQTTRLIKMVCKGCSMVIRSSRKWIDDVGCPRCACGGDFVVVEPKKKKGE